MLKNKVRSIVAGCCAAALCLMSTTGAYAATSREYSNSACTNAVALNKTVTFTDVNKSITFKHKSMPSVDTVYMKASLTYGNGSKASMSGTIRTNG